MRLVATLPVNRSQPGTLVMFCDDGQQLSFRCLGKADNAQAAAAGNPTRDWHKTDGDTPLGVFPLKRVPAAPTAPTNLDELNTSWSDAANLRSYGPGARFVFVGSPRPGILLHGGALAADGRSLRPTHGCLRVDDSTISAIDARWPGNHDVISVQLEVREVDPVL